MLRLGILSYLGQRIDKTADKTDEDSRHTAKRDRSIEEDQATERNGKLVQSTDHRVRRGRGDADGPGRSVRDKYCGETGDNHDDDDGIALLGGEVLLDVGGGPVFNEDGGDEQNRNSKEVVVVHGCSESVEGNARGASNVLSKSLKLVSLMRFLMPKT